MVSQAYPGIRLVVGNVVPSLGPGDGDTLKTRCAEKSTAEH